MGFYRYMYWGLLRTLPKKNDPPLGGALLLILGSGMALQASVFILDHRCNCIGWSHQKSAWFVIGSMLVASHFALLLRRKRLQAILDYYDSSGADAFVAASAAWAYFVGAGILRVLAIYYS